MKLLFPNGEHSQVLLNEGVSRIGSAADCQVMLDCADIREHHAELVVEADSVKLRPAVSAVVSVNGTPVTTETALNPGDRMSFAAVQARLVAVERAASVARPAARDVDDSGATKVRMALPKLILRGVSGAAFGKTFPVAKEMIIGRQHDCDIPIPAEEISRHHVRVKPAAEGLMVEDLGSANGTYINGKRIQQAVMKAGDELRLDSIRFMLIAPGMEIPRAAESAARTSSNAASSSKLPLIVGAIVALVAAAAAGWFFFLR